MSVFEALDAVPLLPVLTFDDPGDAVRVCTTLRDGGIRAVEITLRTSAGIAAIERVAAETDLVVGAGTVLSADDVRRVTQSGAEFVVSPGYDGDVVDTARDAGIPAVPGVATPTEIQRALRHGCTYLKVFPADSLGGPAYLRHLMAPFPRVRLLPSGGITFDSFTEYLRVPSVFAVSGSWMVPKRHAGGGAAIRDMVVASRERVASVRHESKSERADQHI